MATHSSILAWRLPVDRGAWRAAAGGVTQSQARLKRLGPRAHAHTCVFAVCSRGAPRVLPSSAQEVRGLTGGLSTTGDTWAAGMQRRCRKAVPWVEAACPEVPRGPSGAETLGSTA